MENRKRFKKSKKAQQLVEFGFVVPILLTVTIVIVEFGFMLNARATISEAVKMSMPVANQMINQPGLTAQKKELIRQNLETYIKQYVTDHNVVYANTISVDIVEIENTANVNSDVAIVLVNYTYTPFFTLPFGALLDNGQGFRFSTYQIINKKTYYGYNISGNLSTQDLSSFWKSTTDLDGRKGFLKGEDIAGMDANDIKKLTALLIYFDDINKSRLFNWWGEDLLPPNLYIDTTTGTLWVKSPYYSTSWFDTKVPIHWVLTGLGFTQTIYAKNNTSNLTSKNYKLDFSSTNTDYTQNVYWCDQSRDSQTGSCGSSSETDFSSDDIYNLLKNSLSFIFDSSAKSYGTYEKVEDRVNTLNTLNGNLMRPYSFYNNSFDSEYLLKLFVPLSSYPSTVSDIYKFKFNLTNGVYVDSGSENVDITDIYLDNDADNVPNAWDLDPNIRDVNCNNILDGNETSLIQEDDRILGLPNAETDASFTAGYSYRPYYNAANPSTYCELLGIKYPFIEYVFDSKEEPSQTIKDAIINSDWMASMPIKLDGSVNTIGSTYIPTAHALPSDIYQVNFTKNERNAACSLSSSSLSVIYYKYNSGGVDYLTRKIGEWSTDSATALTQKTNFINNSGISGDEIELGKSRELESLTNGNFSTSNKAVVTYE